VSRATRRLGLASPVVAISAELADSTTPNDAVWLRVTLTAA
jgi:hypothetical protein